MTYLLVCLVSWLFITSLHVIVYKRTGPLDKHFALLSVFVILSFTRSDLYSGDFINYRGMVNFETWELYYVKEFIFWGLISNIHKITKDFYYTVYIFDVVILSFLFLVVQAGKSRMRFSTIGLSVIIFLSFPVMMGFSNTYRQLSGLVVFFAALSREMNPEPRSKLITHLLFLTALFTHNVFLLFYLIYVGSTLFKNMFLSAIITVAILLTTFTTLKMLGDLSGNVVSFNGVKSGQDTRFLLLLMNITVYFIFLSIKNGDIPRNNNQIRDLKRFGFSVFFIAIGMYIIGYGLNESVLERLLMISFTIILFLAIKMYERTKVSVLGTNLFKMSLLVSAVLPIFVSSSAFNLIFTRVS